MKSFILALALGGSLLVPTAKGASSEIPVIMVNEAGLVETLTMSVPDYQVYLEKLLPAVEKGVVSAMNSLPGFSDPNNPWEMRTVIIGAGLKVSIGGSFLGMGASGGAYLMYSNSNARWIP